MRGIEPGEEQRHQRREGALQRQRLAKESAEERDVMHVVCNVRDRDARLEHIKDLQQERLAAESRLEHMRDHKQEKWLQRHTSPTSKEPWVELMHVCIIYIASRAS